MSAISGIMGMGTDIAGGVASGKSAKKAAEIEAQEAAANRQLYTDMINKYTQAVSPYTTAGSNATTAQENWLGLNGAAASGAQQQAFDNFKNSTGYQNALGTGLNAINSNAYSQGLGDSGATMKALDTYGSNLANTYGNQYYADLAGLGSQGLGAIESVGNMSQAATNGEASANTAQGDAEANGITQSTSDLYGGISKGMSDLSSALGGASSVGGLASSFGF